MYHFQNNAAHHVIISTKKHINRTFFVHGWTQMDTKDTLSLYSLY